MIFVFIFALIFVGVDARGGRKSRSGSSKSKSKYSSDSADSKSKNDKGAADANKRQRYRKNLERQLANLKRSEKKITERHTDLSTPDAQAQLDKYNEVAGDLEDTIKNELSRIQNGLTPSGLKDVARLQTRLRTEEKLLSCEAERERVRGLVKSSRNTNEADAVNMYLDISEKLIRKLRAIGKLEEEKAVLDQQLSALKNELPKSGKGIQQSKSQKKQYKGKRTYKNRNK